MKSTFFPPLMIGVGLLLLITSFCWARLVTNRGSWSEAQADELTDLGGQLHALHYSYELARERQGTVSDDPGALAGHHHAGVEVPHDMQELKAKLDAVKAEHEALTAQLDAAKQGRGSLANVFWWLGISFSAIGVTIHFVFQTSWAQRMFGEE